MNSIYRTFIGCSLLISHVAAVAWADEGAESPANQIFQFMHSATCASWADGSKTDATAYLWIPEKCQKVRGLLILCTNVPEHMLVGHAAIRKACAENDLGIVWCVPSFMNFRKGQRDMTAEAGTITRFLQDLLDGLAKTSGYDEIATVPWLPMGESGHLLMVDALVEANPDRCIAGVWIKNNHFPPHDRKTPALVIYGTAQEWSQDKTDIRTKWNDVVPSYEKVVRNRAGHQTWPLSYVVDGWSGHFDCSERLTAYIAHYIDQVSKARLPVEGNALKPIEFSHGFLADLPLPGHENHRVIPFDQAGPESRGQPWYFDKASAEEAQSIAAIKWKAQSQLPGYIDTNGNVMPFDFNGITKLKTIPWEADHETFAIHGKMLEQIPSTFVGAGEKLATTPGEPVAEWLCGSVEPLGNNRFRIGMDRTWSFTNCYLALRQPGDADTRSAVQPIGVDLKSLTNREGKPQKITFEKPLDAPVGTVSVPLVARSDSGLPVRFFVVAGPAMVQGNQLMMRPVPPRTKYPVAITLAAWQWGSNQDPKVQTAEMVKHTFELVAK